MLDMNSSPANEKVIVSSSHSMALHDLQGTITLSPEHHYMISRASLYPEFSLQSPTEAFPMQAFLGFSAAGG